MIKEHWQTAWTHIRRSPYQSLAVVLIMTWIFYIATVFFLTAAGFEVILHYFETRPQVTAFFKDETTMEEVDQLKAKLEESEKVKELKYVSKEEALAIYREQNQDDPLLLEMVTANILPASLEVSTGDLAYLGDVAEILRQEPTVEEVIFQEEVVKTLREKTLALRRLGLELIGSLGLVSLLIVLIAISMKVVVRREEIKILQLIGAGVWYIRAPFIFEGIFYCLVGSLLGWGLGYLRLLYSTPFLVDFLAGIPVLPVPILFMVAILGAEVLLAVLIGALGSFMAVKRYLR